MYTMGKFKLIFVFGIFQTINLIAQPEKGTVNATFDSKGSVNGIREISTSVKITEGSIDYMDDWVNGNIELMNTTKIDGIPINYDINNNVIKSKFDKDIRLLAGNSVKNFQFNSGLLPMSFVNCNQYPNKELGHSGFYLELSVGKLTLLEKASISLIKSNYNEALAVGDRNDKLIKTFEYFFFRNSVITKLPKSKKLRLELFKDQKASVDSYVKKESLSLKKIDDFIIIVDYYNSL